ncbi:MAG: hypothetical protein JWM59_3321 [Verrucomicrobiales bacterium]|nr:hypothetical protein [Verrucomicrobiales bacterium]
MGICQGLIRRREAVRKIRLGAQRQAAWRRWEKRAKARKLGAADRTALEKALTYFRNNVERMDYAARAAAGLPIGSGVTEAGSKLPVKKRLCGPGMTWGFTMAGHILRLRAPAHSAGRRRAGLWKAILT